MVQRRSVFSASSVPCLCQMLVFFCGLQGIHYIELLNGSPLLFLALHFMDGAHTVSTYNDEIVSLVQAKIDIVRR